MAIALRLPDMHLNFNSGPGLVNCRALATAIERLFLFGPNANEYLRKVPCYSEMQGRLLLRALHSSAHYE